jgi:hypothetical protein
LRHEHARHADELNRYARPYDAARHRNQA